MSLASAPQPSNNLLKLKKWRLAGDERQEAAASRFWRTSRLEFPPNRRVDSAGNPLLESEPSGVGDFVLGLTPFHTRVYLTFRVDGHCRGCGGRRYQPHAESLPREPIPTESGSCLCDLLPVFFKMRRESDPF